MTLLEVIAILITLTAIFSYLNERFIKLPVTIGVMLISLVISLVLVGLNKMGFGLEVYAQNFFSHIDFNQALMHGMLSFLLFAGALHVELEDLLEYRKVISILATFGIIVSTFLIGTGIYFVYHALGGNISYVMCLLFGSLISPTDPIAVLGILKRINVPKSLEIRVAGESLFNDGVGVVLFTLILGVATKGQDISASHIVSHLLLDAGGGAILGFVLGWLAYKMLKNIDNYQTEILITLALVMGGYALAMALHVSGPIAVVVAGLLIGNHGRSFAMSKKTEQHLDTFWELIDEILNAVLFVLIGLEVIILQFSNQYLIAGLLAIPLVLLGRWISIAGPALVLKRWLNLSLGEVNVMTWGGLRGGISIALALSIPKVADRGLLVAVTYCVVVFSILVQGLTIPKVIRRCLKI